MTNEISLDYRFAVESPADAHHARKMSDLMESSPNPIGFGVQGSAPYSARFQMRAFGNIGLLEYRMDSPAGSDTLFVGERTRSHIAHNHSLEFQIIIWLGGENRLDMGGCMHPVQAGDFNVASTDTTLGAHMLSRGHACCFALPASWDRIGDTQIENVLGKLYPWRDRRNIGLVNYARHLNSTPDSLALPGAAEKLYDVIALALDPRAKNAHRNGLLTLIRNHIDIYCVSPDLAPCNVAAVFDISVRYLHQLFAASDTSFTEYLIEQRLTQARRLLSDSRCLQKTILSIAFDCGFRDINHFGRRFRARYDVTPGEFRRATVAPSS